MIIIRHSFIQLDKVVKVAVEYRLSDSVAFSRTCFAKTEFRGFLLQCLLKVKYFQVSEEPNRKQCHNFGSTVGSITQNTKHPFYKLHEKKDSNCIFLRVSKNVMHAFTMK